MKARKFAWAFAVTAMVAAGAFFIGCSNGSTSEDETVISDVNGGHQHTFATTWSSDATGHWYAATCDHTTEKKDFAAHTSSGSATRESAEVCTVCGYEIAPRIYLGSKTPLQAKAVGDIVFNDGSATPYSAGLTLTDDQKNAAVAVIFYVGTGLNSDASDGTPDNVTSRTLGVGLKYNKGGLEWCTTTAAAHTVNIATIQCPASGSIGAFTFTGDKNGCDNLEQIASFLAGSNDTTDSSKYPAFYFAKNYKDIATNLGTSYEAGWYLPSVAELFSLYQNLAKINASIALCVGSQFSNGQYWTSSPYDAGGINADLITFSDGDLIYRRHDHLNQYVCAIREFN